MGFTVGLLVIEGVGLFVGVDLGQYSDIFTPRGYLPLTGLGRQVGVGVLVTGGLGGEIGVAGVAVCLKAAALLLSLVSVTAAIISIGSATKNKNAPESRTFF